MIITQEIWFWTFSTIAQVCAAILALGGTFVVFKIDKITTCIYKYREIIIDLIFKIKKTQLPKYKYPNIHNFKIIKEFKKINVDILTAEKLDELRKYLISSFGFIPEPNTNTGTIDLIKTLFEYYKINYKRKNEVFRNLRHSFIFLSINIIISLILLSVEFIKLDYGLFLFYFVLLYSIFSILYTVILFWRIIYSNYIP
ncbi:MAG: hypothetical protein ABIE68_04655 [bacterium]